MAHRNYTCLVAVGFAFMVVAFVLALVALLTTSWVYTNTNGYYDNNYNYLDGSLGLATTCSGSSCSGNGELPTYRRAALGLMIVGVILSPIGMLCLFIYLCGNCCCGVSRWMTVMPKINIICAVFGSVCVGAACAVFLIGFYLSDDKQYSSYYTYNNNYYYLGYTFIWLPGFSFYLACVSSVLMFISGVVAIGAKDATSVDVAPNNQPVLYQPQQVQPYMPPQPQPMGYQSQPMGYQPQPMGYQPGPYYLPGGANQSGSYPLKTVVVNSSTQTV